MMMFARKALHPSKPLLKLTQGYCWDPYRLKESWHDCSQSGGLPLIVLSASLQRCVQPLQASWLIDKMLCRLLQNDNPVPLTAVDAVFALFAWDAGICIMALNVYHDRVKILVLTDQNPKYFANFSIPLLTDDTSRLPGFYTFANDLMQYKSVTSFLIF
ncbi:hypothetical protein Plhal304r1_c032g0103741 [Plasmopara halstedii]